MSDAIYPNHPLVCSVKAANDNVKNFLLGAKVKSALVTPLEAVTLWFVTTPTFLQVTTITLQNVIIAANCNTNSRCTKNGPKYVIIFLTQNVIIFQRKM